MVLDDGYDYQAGEDFLMLARKDKKFYDVTHMLEMQNGQKKNLPILVATFSMVFWEFANIQKMVQQLKMQSFHVIKDSFNADTTKRYVIAENFVITTL